MAFCTSKVVQKQQHRRLKKSPNRVESQCRTKLAQNEGTWEEKSDQTDQKSVWTDILPNSMETFPKDICAESTA